METIFKDEMPCDGVFVNLDLSSSSYESLLYNHYKYLDKNKKYYFYCEKGVKSRKVTSVLEAYGYNVVRVIDRV